MNNNKSIFFGVPDGVKSHLLGYIDSQTRQNLFIEFHEDFYNFVKSKYITKLLKLLDNSNNTWSISNNIHVYNKPNIQARQLIYICQKPIFENMLLELQNLFFKTNLQLYNQFEKIIYEFYFFKLSHPVINGIEITTNNNNFNLINMKQLNWIINNRNELHLIIDTIPTTSVFFVNYTHMVADKTFCFHSQDTIFNTLQPIIRSNINIKKKLPFYNIFLDKNLILAGGSISALLYNLCRKPEVKIQFKDIDLFYFEGMYEKPLLEILQELYKYFRKIKLNFICFQKTFDNYWLSDDNSYIQINKKDLKPIEKLYYRKEAYIFDIILIDDNVYEKFNLPKNKQFFLSTICIYFLLIYFTYDIFLKIIIAYCNNNTNINNNSSTINFIQDAVSYELKSDAIAYYQCISLKYNKPPNNLRLATNILLNDFDISMCQSAMFKEDSKYNTVCIIFKVFNYFFFFLFFCFIFFALNYKNYKCLYI